IELHAVEHAEEIEMPISATKLAISRELEPDFRLLLDDLFVLAALNVFELLTANRACFAFGARLLQGLAAQKAAHMVGAKRRCLVGRRHTLAHPIPFEAAGAFSNLLFARVNFSLFFMSERLGLFAARPR